MSTKTSSVISAVITIILLILLGVFTFFIQLVALNGYGESEGGTALVLSGICLSIGVILSVILAGWLTRLFITKFNWNQILAIAASVFAGLILGGGLGVVSLFISIFVAGALHSL